MTENIITKTKAVIVIFLLVLSFADTPTSIICHIQNIVNEMIKGGTAAVNRIKMSHNGTIAIALFPFLA
jgi:hypothetical protein